MQFFLFVLIVGIIFALISIVMDNSHPNHPQ